MTDSVREQILVALQTRLSTALGLTVERVPRIDPTYQTRDIVGLIDGDDVVTDTEYGQVTAVMTVAVQRAQAIDVQTQNESVVANQLLGALIAAATGTDRTLGGLCDKILYTGGGPAYGIEPSAAAAAVANFDITYRFAVGDPTRTS